MSESDILNRLGQVLRQRKSAAPESSYVASLYAGGLDAILQKVGEEAIELVLAAKGVEPEGLDSSKVEVIKETADLWFHTLVLLAELDISPNELLAELDERFGTSGHAEKAARAK